MVKLHLNSSCTLLLQCDCCPAVTSNHSDTRGLAVTYASTTHTHTHRYPQVVILSAQILAVGKLQWWLHWSELFLVLGVLRSTQFHTPQRARAEKCGLLVWTAKSAPSTTDSTYRKYNFSRWCKAAFMVSLNVILEVFCRFKREEQSRHTRLACLNSKLLLEWSYEECN